MATAELVLEFRDFDMAAGDRLKKPSFSCRFSLDMIPLVVYSLIMKTNTAAKNEPASKWAAIKTGTGRITGYIEVFRSQYNGKTIYVTIPGASRFRAA